MGTVFDLPIQKVKSLEALVKEINGEVSNEDYWIQLEGHNPDYSFFSDVSLESLIDSLKENGLTEEQIKSFSLAMYGPVIDFYQVGTNHDKFYVMAVGQR